MYCKVAYSAVALSFLSRFPRTPFLEWSVVVNRLESIEKADFSLCYRCFRMCSADRLSCFRLRFSNVAVRQTSLVMCGNIRWIGVN
jgi:hypothetical protein